jgi:soluble lytic murein transglycosylase-like protein
LKTDERRPVENIEEMIRRTAREYGVDAVLAIKVAQCESNLNPKARRVNTLGSVDRGLYQWNSFWHKEISDEVAYDAELATRKFCEAVKKGKLWWWNASKKCWK